MASFNIEVEQNGDYLGEPIPKNPQLNEELSEQKGGHGSEGQETLDFENQPHDSKQKQHDSEQITQDEEHKSNNLEQKPHDSDPKTHNDGFTSHDSEQKSHVSEQEARNSEQRTHDSGQNTQDSERNVDGSGDIAQNTHNLNQESEHDKLRQRRNNVEPKQDEQITVENEEPKTSDKCCRPGICIRNWRIFVIFLAPLLYTPLPIIFPNQVSMVTWSRVVCSGYVQWGGCGVLVLVCVCRGVLRCGVYISGSGGIQVKMCGICRVLKYN